MQDDIEVSLEVMKKIKNKLERIKRISREKRVKEEIETLVAFIDNNILDLDENIEKLETLINNEMKRVKFLDDDLYLKLYILGQDLKKGKIVPEEVVEFLKTYTLLDDDVYEDILGRKKEK
ncbi:hypothetical protein ACFIJ5_11595 [Haloimpatiens sp. FM7330]|uniref:hypothetical protein n=1 Tax=Haloimpatiens sp. FM7330 TaxID=3298610 RepID=UPI00363A2396